MKKIICLLTAITLSIAFPLYSSPEGEANYAIASSYFLEVLNQRKHELIDEIFSEDLQFIGNNGKWSGTENVKKFAQGSKARGDEFEILEHIADEEKVYIMFRLTSPWPDYAPASESKETTSLIRHARMWIKNGKITEFRLIDSRLDQLKELSGFEGTFAEMVEALSSK